MLYAPAMRVLEICEAFLWIFGADCTWADETQNVF
jgi:hypothetical protein